MEEVFAVYVWSQDWWTFSNDSWSARDQVYEDSRIVSHDKVNWQKVSDGEAYHASLYFEIGKTDAHDFRPTSIMVDNVDQPTMVVIEGEEVDENDNVIGEAYPFEFAVGQKEVIYVSWYGLRRLHRYGNHLLRMKKQRKTKL